MTELSTECSSCGETLWIHKVDYTQWSRGMCRDCFARKIVTEMFEDAKRNGKP